MVIKIGIIDPYPAFCEGVKSNLNKIKSKKVVLIENSFNKGIQKVKQIKVDLLLISNDLTDYDELKLIKFKKTIDNKPFVIILFNKLDIKSAFNFINQGINGLINKRWTFKQYRTTITNVLKNKVVFNRQVVAYIENTSSHKKSNVNIDCNCEFKFTNRQREVLKYLRQGLSLLQIADKMYVSNRTVHGHVRDIKIKTRATSLHHLMVALFECGVYDPKKEGLMLND